MEFIMELFWSKVKKSKNCWVWTASKDKCGYGRFLFNKKNRCAHSVAYELTYGKIPDKPYELAHNCNNPACVNPYHLRVATRSSNMLDKRAAGTAYVNQSLTPEHVHWIRQLHKYGWEQKRIAKLFKKSPSTIHSIVNRLSYKNIQEL